MRFESEKRELERKLETKEATLMAERRNNEEWRKNQIAIRVDLQRKVDNLKPEIDRLEHMVGAFTIVTNFKGLILLNEPKTPYFCFFGENFSTQVMFNPSIPAEFF